MTVEKSKPVGTAGAVVDVVEGPVLPVQAGPVDDELGKAFEDGLERRSDYEGSAGLSQLSRAYESAVRGGEDEPTDREQT